MDRELKLKKCLKCGAVVKIIVDCNCNDCGISCCDEKMFDVKSNSTDASFEKHVPEITIKENKVIVKINHVMEEEHYIEWISLVNDNFEEIKYLKPTEEAVVTFDYIPNSRIYSYCNKHGLWEKEIN